MPASAGEPTGELGLKDLQINSFLALSKAVGGRKVAQGFESLPLRLDEKPPIHAASRCASKWSSRPRDAKSGNAQRYGDALPDNGCGGHLDRHRNPRRPTPSAHPPRAPKRHAAAELNPAPDQRAWPFTFGHRTMITSSPRKDSVGSTTTVARRAAAAPASPRRWLREGGASDRRARRRGGATGCPATM